jgi:hypothetical protein
MAFRIVRRLQRRGEEQTVASEAAGEVLRIGRGTDNDLQLEDLGVSFSHATITLAAEGPVLCDLTGVGLTLLNRVPVREATLRPGDLIRIGPYQLRPSPGGPGEPLTIHVEEDRDRAAAEKVALYPRYSLATARWNKRALSLLISLVVLGGAVLAFALGRHGLFMPGEVSLKHSLFANDCLKCHVPWKAVWEPVPDKTCIACHAGPAHFQERALGPAPQCATCHAEHKGQVRLAVTPDRRCVACHEDLKVKEGEARFETSVRSFTTAHPEFAVSVGPPDLPAPNRVRLTDKDALVDHAQLKLNHKLHLAPELAGPDGPEQLACTGCHRPDLRGAYMQPINYQRDCQRCHVLDFDDRLGVKTVPHPQKPEDVRRFLQATYAEYYLLTHEDELRGRPAFRRLPGAPPTKEELWVGDMTAKAEQYLYSKKTKKCLLCHVVELPGPPAMPAPAGTLSAPGLRALPVVARPAVPERWMPHSVFNHAPHNTLIQQKGCVACHAGAETSDRTEHVLMPSINACRTCHYEPNGARAQCVECHVYHDKSKARQSEHPYELDEIKRRAGGE